MPEAERRGRGALVSPVARARVALLRSGPAIRLLLVAFVAATLGAILPGGVGSASAPKSAPKSGPTSTGGASPTAGAARWPGRHLLDPASPGVLATRHRPTSSPDPVLCGPGVAGPQPPPLLALGGSPGSVAGAPEDPAPPPTQSRAPPSAFRSGTT